MKLTKTKICGSLAVAATIAVFSGCGDESTTNNIDNTAVLAFDADSLPECAKANEGELAFNKTDNTLRICYDTEWYVLNGKDGQKGKTGEQGKKGETGDDGTGCTVKALDDKSGLKLICDGDSLGVVLNGKQGEPGDQGNSCVKCEAVDVTEDGYSIKCDGEVVATILNGSAVPATKSSDSKPESATGTSSSSNGVPIAPANSSSSSNGVPIAPANSSSSSNGVPIAPANSSSSSNGVPIAPANSSSSNAKSSSSDESSSSGFNMGNCPEGTSSPSGYSATVFPDGLSILGAPSLSSGSITGKPSPIESGKNPVKLTSNKYSIDCNKKVLINKWSLIYSIPNDEILQAFGQALSEALQSNGFDDVQTIHGGIQLNKADESFAYFTKSSYGDAYIIELVLNFRESLEK